MSIFARYQSRYEALQEEELSVQEYLDVCKNDPTAYASVAERMLLAIGEPELVDTRSDARLSPRPAVRTSEDGRFRHAGLLPGRWRVRASRPDWPRSVEDRVDVRLGEPSQVSLIAPR